MSKKFYAPLRAIQLGESETFQPPSGLSLERTMDSVHTGRSSTGTMTPSVAAFPPAVWASLQCHLVWAYRGCVPPAFRSCQVDHTGHLVTWLVEQGQIRIDDGTQNATGRPGEWLVSPRGRFRQEITQDTRLISINVACRWPGGRDPMIGNWAEIISSKACPRLCAAARNLVNAAETILPDNSAAMEFRRIEFASWWPLQSLAMQWTGELFPLLMSRGWLPTHATRDERTLRIYRLLQNPPLTEEALRLAIKEETNLSLPSASLMFRKEYGLTLADFWNRRRLDHIKGLITLGTLSLKELSAALGFSKQSHFTRWFKNRTGTCPRDFQRTASQH